MNEIFFKQCICPPNFSSYGESRNHHLSDIPSTFRFFKTEIGTSSIYFIFFWSLDSFFFRFSMTHPLEVVFRGLVMEGNYREYFTKNSKILVITALFQGAVPTFSSSFLICNKSAYFKTFLELQLFQICICCMRRMTCPIILTVSSNM